MSHYVLGRKIALRVDLLTLKREKRKVKKSLNNLLMWKNYKQHNAMYMYTMLDGGG
jgi:predicted metalloprotease with PDZ domain